MNIACTVYICDLVTENNTSDWLNIFLEKSTILKRSTAGRPDADREKRKDEKQTLKLTVLYSHKPSHQWSNDVTNGQIGQCFSGKIFVDRGGI